MNINFYKTILNTIEKTEQESKESNLFLKLKFYYHAREFDNFQNLDNESQEKIINFITSYFLDVDLVEYTEYDIIETIFNSYYEIFEIIKDIKNIDYKNFCNILDNKF